MPFEPNRVSILCHINISILRTASLKLEALEPAGRRTEKKKLFYTLPVCHIFVVFVLQSFPVDCPPVHGCKASMKENALTVGREEKEIEGRVYKNGERRERGFVACKS